MAKLKKAVKMNLIVVIILLAIILVTFVAFSYNHVYKPEANDDEPVEEPIKTYKASLIATGDSLIHGSVYRAAYDDETKTYDFHYMLEYTKDKIKDYDIKYYNQETVIDTESEPSTYPRFNTPEAWGYNMLDIGFNMVSLATNHSMDKGADGAKRAASWWESKEDVLTHGMASSEEKRSAYKIMEANGITYTLLSYTYGTNGLGGADLQREPYIVNVFDEEMVKKDIAAVRDKVDVLIVAMHWGTEYKQDATDKQKEQAKFLADNGVDIVLGTHSHCIEPWEKIGNTVVFYSFGNFISDQNHSENPPFVRKVASYGMFATLDIIKTVDTINQTTTITIDNIGADLNYTYKYYNDEKKKNDFNVIPFSKMESKYLEDYESMYEEFSAVLKKYDDSIKIEELPKI